MTTRKNDRITPPPPAAAERKKKNKGGRKDGAVLISFPFPAGAAGSQLRIKAMSQLTGACSGVLVVRRVSRVQTPNKKPHEAGAFAV